MFTDSFIIVVDFLHIMSVHIHVDYLLDAIIAHQVINLSTTFTQKVTVRTGIGVITRIALVNGQSQCGTLLA